MNRNFVFNFSNFVLKTVVVTKPLTGIFLSITLIFFSKFCLSVFYWFMWFKVVSSGLFFSRLLGFVFLQLGYLLHH